MHVGPTQEQRVAGWILIACRASRVGIGLYFVVWRPPLLPEDVRSIGMSLFDVERIVPVAGWLQKVFWVLGAYLSVLGCSPCTWQLRRCEPGAYQSPFCADGA